MSRWLLVRHGASSGNNKEVFLGRLDEPLTEQGWAQARHLAQRLAHEPVTSLYSSPLERALHTAETIGESLGLPVQQVDALAEQDFGSWDGLAPEEVKRRYAGYYLRWRDGDPSIPPHDGEALRDVAERLAPTCMDLAARYQNGETLVMVSHAGVIQTILCLLLDTPLRNTWPYQLPVGCFAELKLYQQGATLCGFGLDPRCCLE